VKEAKIKILNGDQSSYDRDRLNNEDSKQQSLFNYYSEKGTSVVPQVGSNVNNRTINHFVSTQKNNNANRSFTTKSNDDEDNDDGDVTNRSHLKPPTGRNGLTRKLSVRSKSIGVDEREGDDENRSNADTDSTRVKKQSNIIRKSQVQFNTCEFKKMETHFLFCEFPSKLICSVNRKFGKLKQYLYRNHL
jgi:hypothetical protein